MHRRAMRHRLRHEPGWPQLDPLPLESGPPRQCEWLGPDPRNPTVVHDGTGYHMWYAGNGPLAIQIGYATSPDGLVWTKVGNGPNFMGHQSWDSGATSTPFVLKVGPTFVLYFSGHPGNFAYSIGRATSSDGVTWTEDLANPLMYAQGGWEESRIHPTWVASAGSGFEMYYTGGYNEPQVGRATSVDGWNWTRDAANPSWPWAHPGPGTKPASRSPRS